MRKLRQNQILREKVHKLWKMLKKMWIDCDKTKFCGKKCINCEKIFEKVAHNDNPGLNQTWKMSQILSAQNCCVPQNLSWFSLFFPQNLSQFIHFFPQNLVLSQFTHFFSTKFVTIYTLFSLKFGFVTIYILFPAKFVMIYTLFPQNLSQFTCFFHNSICAGRGCSMKILHLGFG